VEILLLHPGGLGDIILSLPAIRLLREKFSAARFTMAGNIDYLRPIVGSWVESVISLSTLPLHNLYAGNPLPQSDVHFWKSFDRVISWTGARDPGFVTNLKAIHPNARVASWKPDLRETRHVSQLFVDSLGSEISEGRTAKAASILPSPEASREALKWLAGRGWNGTDSIAVLHPGAGSKAKQWPIPRFINLALHLVQQRKRPFIIEGPAEPGLAFQIRKGLPGVATFMAESLPLDLLAALILQCGLFVGNDSGIAHLAAALGVPSVVLFGPTSPRHWAPLGPQVKVLRDFSGCLENITVNDVLEALSL
jgi:ADP-heptose:LPS heptosyltransferase